MANFADEPSFSPLISIPTGQVRSGVLKKRKAGRKKFNETRHPIYKGVRQRCGKWVCEMRQPNDKKSRIWLGTFTSPDMAARAYDVAAFALKGDSASLNFPNEASTSTHIDQPSACNIAKDVDDQCAYLKMAGEGFNDEVEEASRKVVYLDEEELFNMPGLIDSMAEGLILTPPAMQKGFNWDAYDDLANNTVEFSLWSD